MAVGSASEYNCPVMAAELGVARACVSSSEPPVMGVCLCSQSEAC